MKKVISMLLIAATLCTCLLAFAGCGPEAQVKVIDIPLSVEKYAFCVNNADTALKDQVNAFLAEIMGNGKFAEICDHYFGEGTPFEFTSATEDETKDQLVVATSTGFEPFEMVDANGKYSGIDMEIAYLLAEELGKELVIKDMEFDAVVTAVETGKADIAMAGLTITPAREAVVTFTDSYYDASQVLIVKADDTTFDECQTVADVETILATMGADKKFGCQKGTTGYYYIVGDKYNADGSLNEDGFGFEGLDVECKDYSYGALAITAMINGDVDCVVLDNAPAKAISAKMNG